MPADEPAVTLSHEVEQPAAPRTREGIGTRLPRIPGDPIFEPTLDPTVAFPLDADPVVLARWLTVVRDLDASLASLRTPLKVYAAACDHLDRHRADLSFALFYAADRNVGEPVGPGATAELACAAGLGVGHPAAPPRVRIGTDDVWPLRDAPVLVPLDARHGRLPTDPCPESPVVALVLPMAAYPGAPPRAWFVAALDSHHALDELYRGFLDLIVSQVNAAVTAATAYEQARDGVSADAAALRHVAAREHRIAEELQTSLLPAIDFDPDHLEVATFYQAGVEGTQVGGDWYDVIELGAGRTALVVGDVMGRGVRAAAVMGQLRAAIRAYARLDLPPADVLELCDGAVRELGEDQIVTTLYAVFDPIEGTLTYANAGHLPPLLVVPGGPTVRLTDGAGPPLGTGPLRLADETVAMAPGATLCLYTDGLVERRDRDIDAGVALLTGELAGTAGDLADLAHLPAALVARLLSDGQDDDVAVLLARVPRHSPRVPSVRFAAGDAACTVATARHWVSRIVAGWKLTADQRADAELLVGELVTNALTHGAAPVEVRLRHARSALLIEVSDAGPFLPRRLRPTADDEHGRGLLLVASLTERWGARPKPTGKAVWCMLPLL